MYLKYTYSYHLVTWIRAMSVRVSGTESRYPVLAVLPAGSVLGSCYEHQSRVVPVDSSVFRLQHPLGQPGPLQSLFSASISYSGHSPSLSAGRRSYNPGNSFLRAGFSTAILSPRCSWLVADLSFITSIPSFQPRSLCLPLLYDLSCLLSSGFMLSL